MIRLAGHAFSFLLSFVHAVAGWLGHGNRTAGAGIGASVGAILGSFLGVLSAGIGGAIGGVVGAFIGSVKDRGKSAVLPLVIGAGLVAAVLGALFLIIIGRRG